MRLYEDHNYLRSEKTYTDIVPKANYLINKHGFALDASGTVLFKKELVIPTAWLYTYEKEQLDTLNFLANQCFINNIYTHQYESEITCLKYDDLHENSLKEIRCQYNMAKQEFREQVTFN